MFASSRLLKKRIIPILLIVAAAFAVYWPALRNGFVWDDTALVLRDPFIRSWRLIPEGFRHFLFTDATASNFYRPIQRLTYTADYALFAFQPWGYHLTNIVLHAAAGVALFLFVRKLVGRFASKQPATLFATIAALFWVIHPLHTSAVIYVSGRADLLAALFGFAGLYLALREKAWAAGLCFLAAMLSKESGIMALAIWLLILCFCRDGFRRWLAIAPLIFAVYFGMRFSAEKVPPPAPEPVPFAVRPILMARAWAEYAGLVIAPVNLHMERDLTVVDRGDMRATLQAARMREFQTLLGMALVVAFALWMRWARRTTPVAFLCLLAFAVAYLPVSNILPLNANVAEHWLYFPGAFLIVATILSLTATRISRILLAGVAMGWIAFLGARTFLRNADWKDERTFLERTIANGGDSARMQINLGLLESSAGKHREAVALINAALKRSPDQPFGLLAMGTASLRAHDYATSREALEKASAIPFVRAEALQDLAVLEYQETRRDRLDLLQEAAALEPKNWAIRKRCILHLDELGRTTEAIAELRRVLDDQPYRAESWRLMGELLEKASQADMARRAYEVAAAYDVHDDESRRKLNSR